MSDVLRSGMLVHGQNGQAFETALAEYLGAADAIVVSSGTAALHIALLAVDIGPSDAVIVPDFTFPATASSVSMTGAQVVVADVDPDTYNITAQSAEAAFDAARAAGHTPRALMIVHEFGTPADLEGLRAFAASKRMHLIEDAACALGARSEGRLIGSDALMACYSFHPRKTLTTGEGGAVVVNDPELAVRLRRLRNHGLERSAGQMRFVEPSTNYRLTDFQSTLGLAQLPHLDDWIAKRRRLAECYFTALESLVQRGALTCPRKVKGQSWQTFMTVLSDKLDRGLVMSALAAQQIEANLGAQCISALAVHNAICPPGLAVASRLYRQGLALPMFEGMEEADVFRVVGALEKVITDAERASS